MVSALSPTQNQKFTLRKFENEKIYALEFFLFVILIISVYTGVLFIGIFKIGSAMETNRGSHGSITTQVQCNAAFSANDVKKLLEEKLDKQLESYIVFFNNTEVKW